MINDRDSYTNLNPSEKISIEFPYRIGTTMEFKGDSDILARICQYRIVFENYKNVIYVGLCFDIYSNNPVIHREISNEELEKYWKVTDKIIITDLNSDDLIKIGIPMSDLHFKPYNYVHSNDEDVIADLLDDFEYDSSKKEEVLAKYEDLKKYIK